MKTRDEARCRCRTILEIYTVVTKKLGCCGTLGNKQKLG
jgi:hypothetical protein